MSKPDDPTVSVGGDDTIPAKGQVPAGNPPPAAQEDFDELPIVEPGSYKLAGEHARGGLGRVLKAYDRRLGRTVAVKELLRLAPAARARFVREAKITARLQHPAIVPIYEAGRWPSGEPFYAMKMVSGLPLSQVIRDASTIEQRLALLPNVISVAEAIAYAHREGVIHRDLKPSNVLVGEFGETVVIDWGIAKDLHDTAAPDIPAGPYRAADDGMTVAGSVLGTPAYMPPEQARGEPVDARADIYSLGALVYHLLAGAPPYGELRGGHSVLEAVLEGPPQDLARLAPEAPADLLAVARKAMARDPDHRYASAAELAADIRRFQTGKLVSAHNYSAAAVLRKWMARNRAAVAVGMLALLALVIGGTLSVRRIIAERETAQRERSAAETERTTAEKRRNELVLLQARAALQTDPTESLRWLKEYPLDAEDWATAYAIADEATQRGYARWVWDRFEGALTTLDIRPDGGQVAVGTSAGDVVLLDSESGDREVLELHKGQVYDIHYSADGSKLVTCDDDGQVAVWELSTRKPVSKKLHNGAVNWCRFAPDASFVATAGQDGIAALWEYDSGDVRRLKHDSPVLDLVVTQDSSTVLIATGGGSVYRWIRDGGAPVLLQEFEQAVLRLAITGNDQVTALVSRVGVSRFDMQAATKASVAVVGSPVYFDQGAEQLVAASLSGGQLRVWAGGATVPMEAQLPSEVAGVNVADAAPVVAAGLSDGSIWLWHEGTRVEHYLQGHKQAVHSVALSRAGDVVASASRAGQVRLWHRPADAGRLLVSEPGAMFTIDCSEDGRQAVIGTNSGTRAVYAASAPGWEVTQLGSHDSDLTDVRVSEHGEYLVTLGQAGTVAIWRADGTSERVELDAHTQRLAVSASAEMVAVSDDRGNLYLIGTDGTVRAKWQAHEDNIYGVEFDAAGERLLSIDYTGELAIWQVPTGRQLQVSNVRAARHAAFVPGGLLVETREATVFRVTPDGTSAVAVDDDTVAVGLIGRTGDYATLSATGEVAVHTLGAVAQALGRAPLPLQSSLIPFADGGAAIVVQSNGTIRVLFAGSVEPLTIVPSSQILDVVPIPATRQVLSTDVLGRVWLWRAQEAVGVVPHEPAAIADWLARATGRQ